MQYKWREIKRRKTKTVCVGKVFVGSDYPVSVQTMTTTDTCDHVRTLRQIQEVAKIGCDIVRVSCPHIETVKSLKIIKDASPIPVVADVHFNYRIAVECARAGVDCIRINPGNIRSSDRIVSVIQAAQDYGCSIRIGVNSGSLGKDLLSKYKYPCPDALVESALYTINLCESQSFDQYKISIKSSDPMLTYSSYAALARLTQCPLHLGVTESGTLLPGTIKSSMVIGRLLWEGIGDTIRVSLASDIKSEIIVAIGILKSLGLTDRGSIVIACPTCARKGFDVIRVAQTVERELLNSDKSVKISVIGCVVNGPGEALTADIGFVGGGGDSGVLYVRGKILKKVAHELAIDAIMDAVEEFF